MKKYIWIFSILFFAMTLQVHAQNPVVKQTRLTKQVKQFGVVEFDIVLKTPFVNPYDQMEIALDLLLTSSSGKKLELPCYYFSGDGDKSVWKGKFTPQEQGKFVYSFQLRKQAKIIHKTNVDSFQVDASSHDGFLHVNDYWTLKFDSGKPFRAIGENVGWESRTFENPKWTYEYLLPTLSSNGANFFRTWMCPWNLPLVWRKVDHTNRYVDSDSYFNASGIQKMDELVALCDSLGLYFMLSIDAHGSLIPSSEWKLNSHNKVNGGPAGTPKEFFSSDASKAMYKNRLRYMIARWGYSTHIAAWEFFNEIDNAVFTPTPHDSILIEHKYITQWHDEMSTYVKKTDPYKHIVTTSVSHRNIKGMNDLVNIDLNQKHIYNKTSAIPDTINEYIKRHHKPYVIGEFGYDWNWDNVKHELGPQFDFDYKRGLWYGMFSPTPILPMTWWWEFFDERKMTPYFKAIHEINELMLNAGKGSYQQIEIRADRAEAFSVKCGEIYFVYLLNKDTLGVVTDVSIALKPGVAIAFDVKAFTPDTREYHNLGSVLRNQNKCVLKDISVADELILIISPGENKTGRSSH